MAPRQPSRAGTHARRGAAGALFGRIVEAIQGRGAGPQGVALVRVPTVEPVRDPAWFLCRLAAAEARAAELPALALGRQ